MGCSDSTPKLNCGKIIPAIPGPPGIPLAIRKTHYIAGQNINLPNGGWKIEIGPDANNDHIPDAVLDTMYIENGARGVSYAIKSDIVPISPSYPNGAYLITYGQDINLDGIPDTITQQFYILNGRNGTDGNTPSFIAGPVTTLPFGSSPYFNIVSLGNDIYRIDFFIPQGPSGVSGSTVSSGIIVGGVTVPTCAQAALSGATNLNDYINYLLAQICDLTQGTMNGNDGDFSVGLGEALTISTSDNTRQQIILLNETLNGCFDKGGYFNGGKYTVPLGGFTGKFQLTDIEIELLVAGTTATKDFVIEVNQYDAVGALTATLASTAFGSLTTDTPFTSKYYPATVKSAVVTLTSGAYVRVDVSRSGSPSGTWPVFRITSLNFNNLAL